jgi:cobalt-zinc-cadmium efflux system outer membrane protein
MKRIFPSVAVGAMGVILALAPSCTPAQRALSWDQVKARFEASNPALEADADNVDEMRAEEITAYLRPNPQLTVAADGTQIAPHDGVWTPFKGTYEQPNFSYLHERDHKRELRLESAQEGTRISEAQHEDLKRNLEFTLRAAFVETLEAKAVLDMAKADLDYYDKIIEISRARLRAGDIAQIDFDRIELLRVQYESELQTAIVNLRTAKIQLLQLLDDRTPLDQFDVTGMFDFSDALDPLDSFRQAALAARPDLQAALETIQQSQTNHKLAWANGSTDPTCAGWYTSQPGREKAHPDRYRSCTAGQRSHQGSGLQRRGHGVRSGAQQHRTAETLQSQVQRRGAAGARHCELRLFPRRRFAHGFS